MKILHGKINNFSDTFLILGFFDGIHAGHRNLILSAVNNAKNHSSKTILITFAESPAVYFGNKPEYIASREHSYNLIDKLGVDYLYETGFKEVAEITAENYLKNNLKNVFSPSHIYTGFNYTFGLNRVGDKTLLYNLQNKYNYKYVCIPEYKINNKTVSSTLIKELLKKGDIITANNFLQSSFVLTSTVKEGMQFGRTIGFPTANMDYPKDIVKIPYGVYKVKIFDKKAVLNWGTRPTLNGTSELLELHIPNFSENLYNKTLTIEVLEKIRDEQKFETPKLLKLQIEKDVEKCLK